MEKLAEGVKIVTAYPAKIKLEEGGILPEKASAQSAGYDLFCPHDFVLRPGRQIIPLNFRIEMREGMKSDIRPRSGNSAKGFKVMFRDTDGIDHEVRVDADVLLGTIDADYRDIVGVILKVNDPRTENGRFYIPKGWSIAQMVFSRVPHIAMQQVDELDMTNDRGGGYGHSTDGK